MKAAQALSALALIRLSTLFQKFGHVKRAGYQPAAGFQPAPQRGDNEKMSAEADVLPVLERIAAAARPDGVVVAGVSGIDCAGKSTYASRLAKQLPPMLAENAAIHVLTIDDFCRPRQERYRNADQALGYYRDSFDYETFFGSLLEPLKKDGRVD